MQPSNLDLPTFKPRCLATTIGSLPHKDVERGTELMFTSTPQIPSWVQFPRRVFHENMMIQFTEGMPALVHDVDRVYFDTQAADYTDQLTQFYDRYLQAMEKKYKGKTFRTVESEDSACLISDDVTIWLGWAEKKALVLEAPDQATLLAMIWEFVKAGGGLRITQEAPVVGSAEE